LTEEKLAERSVFAELRKNATADARK